MRNLMIRVGLSCLSLAAIAGCDSMMHHDSDKSMDKPMQTQNNNGNVPPGSGSTVSTTSPSMTMGTPSTPIKDENNKLPALTHKYAVAVIGPSKNATTQPSNNNVTGRVTFDEADGKVTITADIKGLAPNSKHGFHIHEKPDISSPDLMSAGGHYDPTGTHKHGDPAAVGMTNMIHAGDMGNLVADDQGNAHLTLTVTDLTVDGPKNAVVGHSVIIHADMDDFMTQPTGKSGGRVAGGIIEPAAGL